MTARRREHRLADGAFSVEQLRSNLQKFSEYKSVCVRTSLRAVPTDGDLQQGNLELRDTDEIRVD